MNIPKPTINYGIYTLSDVASILKIPNYRIRYWMSEFWNYRFTSKTFRSYSWGEGREKATSFFTLIEFYIFYKLRDFGLSANKVLNAHETIAKEINTPFPFASSTILTDGERIFFSTDDLKTLYQADKTLQSMIIKVIKEFCKKIDFNSSKLAERYYPLGKKNSVIVDPRHQFGQPIIGSTNVLTETIYNLYKGNESKSKISKIYGISIKQIENAIKFYD